MEDHLATFALTCLFSPVELFKWDVSLSSKDVKFDEQSFTSDEEKSHQLPATSSVEADLSLSSQDLS